LFDPRDMMADRERGQLAWEVVMVKHWFRRSGLIAAIFIVIALVVTRIATDVAAQSIDGSATRVPAPPPPPASARAPSPPPAPAGVVADAFGPDNLNDDSVNTALSNDARGKSWPSAGHDLLNTRNQPNERRISRSNANTLMVKWVFQTEGDIWATPAIDDKKLYVPDAAGNLFAIDTKTGTKVWSKKISDYTGIANDISRTTPAITKDALVFGDQGGRQGQGASVMAVHRNSGQLLWVTKVDDNPAAVITQSPVVFRDMIYVGVSSLEESWASSSPNYPCCSFRGSMIALDRRTGKVRWKTYTIPSPGYSGGSVWGSTAVIDSRRNSVYVTSGNNYTVPQGILDCQSAGDPAAVQACMAAVPGSLENHFDSVLSLDMRTGAIKWARGMVPFDSWNIACVFATPGNEDNCTDPSGEDFDFGQGPTLFTTRMNGRSRDVLGAGQKSGQYWALNPDDGSVIWSRQVGPGGSLGGFEWASATDGQRIYGAIANSRATPWMYNGVEIRNGFWTALDAATGNVLWQTPGNPAVRTTNQGPVSVANGVVYAGTIDRFGTMYALDAATGNTLWTFGSGGSVNAGAAIVDGSVYWGSGYGVRGIGLTPNNKLYAFSTAADCQRAGTCTGGGGVGGAGTGGGGGGGTGGGGGGPLPTTWSGIYAAYLGPGTSGHCSGCHDGSGRVVPLNTASVAYNSLVQVGQINGVGSPIAKRGLSRLSWMGGDMPPAGPTSNPDAEQAIVAWVAAGAPNN
jgi:polyvinyl alcohol dehydrogenase (cytochrome)